MTPPKINEEALQELSAAMERADVVNDSFAHIFGTITPREDNYPEDTAERLAEYRMEEAEHLRDCQEDR